MIDWSTVLSSKKNVSSMKNFATGTTTGKELYANFANTDGGGTVRTLLRDHGVTYSRRLARKALKRRGY